MILLLLVAMGCRDEADDWACIGPLVELVRWRDELEARRLYGGETMTEAQVAAEEARHLEAAVAALRPKRRQCELTWNLQTMQEADNPGLVLRERAIRAALEVPAP